MPDGRGFCWKRAGHAEPCGPTTEPVRAELACGRAYDIAPFAAGDVVYCEGASAILGDVIDVDEDGDGVYVRWRMTETREEAEDLVHADDEPRAPWFFATMDTGGISYSDAIYTAAGHTEDEAREAIAATYRARNADYPHDDPTECTPDALNEWYGIHVAELTPGACHVE